jgi:hypothetical protein
MAEIDPTKVSSRSTGNWFIATAGFVLLGSSTARALFVGRPIDPLVATLEFGTFCALVFAALQHPAKSSWQRHLAALGVGGLLGVLCRLLISLL